MSAGQRLALLAAAAIVLVGGFLIARGSDDDDKDTASTPTTQPATTGGATSTTATEPQQATSQEAPAPRVETIVITGGKNASGDTPELKYDKGETVRLKYKSDEAVEVHLHGYDKAVEVPAGGTKTLTFTADLDGIFEIENEEAGNELAKLVVEP